MARTYTLLPCSVPDCPDPEGGYRKKPHLSPRRLSLSRVCPGLKGVACQTCFMRLFKRKKRGFPLFAAKQVQGPCFETAAFLQMHERKRFLCLSLPVLNLPFTIDDLRGRAWTAAVVESGITFDEQEVA